MKIKQKRRRNFADVSLALPMSQSLANITPEELAAAPMDKNVLVKVSSDPNTFANAVLVGAAVSGVAVGTVGFANAAMVQARLNKIAKTLQSKLGPGSAIWRQLKKFSLFAGSSILGWLAAYGLVGGAVYNTFASMFGPELAGYGAEGMRALAELKAYGAAYTGLSAAAGAGAVGAAYRVGAPKAGEKAAIKGLNKAKAKFPTLKEQGLAIWDSASSTIGNKLSSLAKMKHFSNVTKRYFAADEVVDAEIVEEAQESRASNQFAQVFAIQNDGSSMLTTLALAGIAAVGVLFGAGGVITSVDAEKRLAAVAKELEKSNKFWFKLKSAILYPFKGPILDELTTQVRVGNVADVAQGTKRADALSNAGYKIADFFA